MGLGPKSSTCRICGHMVRRLHAHDCSLGCPPSRGRKRLTRHGRLRGSGANRATGPAIQPEHTQSHHVDIPKKKVNATLSDEAPALYGGVPFISRTFSQACPTRAPGDANRIHTVLNTFFQASVRGEEKRRLQQRVTGLYPLFSFLLIGGPHLTVERAGKTRDSTF